MPQRSFTTGRHLSRAKFPKAYPGSYCTDMLRLFGEANVNKLYKHLLKTHYSFDTTKHTDLLNLIDDIFEKAFFDYHEVEANLEQLSQGMKDVWHKRIIRCIRELLEFLPQYKEVEAFNECVLRTRFLDPVVKYFLNDINDTFRLRYPESNLNERKLVKKEVLRPDCLVTNTTQPQYHRGNIAYGEAISSYYTNRTRALILYMYQLVYFSKSTIDTHKINAPIMLQVVGLKVNVYTLVLISQKFYVTLFLFDFILPQCKSEIKDFLPSIKKLVAMNEALVKCSNGDNKADSEMIRPSNDTPLFERRVETKIAKEESDSIHLC
ncbi:uncharacterized protein ATC70_008442 [Mucor velutinosus]|uniref:Uncharacterized protein n=1 Tax=Mucor velutinosus TaxID=708070 RepID=A0AAN7HPZ7_9FUNG|nr:hypothetical protein ATC70_008442 [Mucor velutinosus]